MESTKANALTPKMVNDIKQIVTKYRKALIEPTDVIIVVETGSIFGHIEMHEVFEVEANDNNNAIDYENSEKQHYVSIRGNVKTILWTDFSDVEPYNRQRVFYVGLRFRNLNEVRITGTYQEFFNDRGITSDRKGGGESFSFMSFKENMYHNEVNFGLCVTKEDADKFITELRIILNKTTKLSSTNQNIKPMQAKVKQKMTVEEIRLMIYKRIKDTYESQKGRLFISHLIRSFLPANKITHIQISEGKMECCITNKKLISTKELADILHQSSYSIDEIQAYCHKRDHDWAAKGHNTHEPHEMDKLLKGRFLGVKAFKSQSYLSEMAWQELNRFVFNEIFAHDNKHISFLISDQYNSEKKENKKRKAVAPIEQRHVNPSPATQTLGDNDVLKQLSKQLSS